MKDSPNGKRWGRRDDDGVIVEAYGFDLAPLAARTEEFEALYARLQEEREFCASVRNTITVTRRIIRAKIDKALESRLRGPWRDLQEEYGVLIEKLPKRTTVPDMLLNILDGFKAFKERVERAFIAAFDWPDESDVSKLSQEAQAVSRVVYSSRKMTPTSLENETHILTTNQPHPVISNRFETKHTKPASPKSELSEQVEATQQVDLDINWSTHTNKRGSEVDIPMLMAACPHFAEMARGVQGYLKDWNDFHRAAATLRPMVGISEDAWNVANKVLGPAIAAASIALIFDKHADGVVKSPGGYLRGLVEKAQVGELHLDRSFYGRLSETRAV